MYACNTSEKNGSIDEKQILRIEELLVCLEKLYSLLKNA